MESTYEIEGMTCGHCVAAVGRALHKLAGVRDARVEIGRAVVVSDAPVDRAAIAAALNEAGYRLRE